MLVDGDVEELTVVVVAEAEEAAEELESRPLEAVVQFLKLFERMRPSLSRAGTWKEIVSGRRNVATSSLPVVSTEVSATIALFFLYFILFFWSLFRGCWWLE